MPEYFPYKQTKNLRDATTYRCILGSKLHQQSQTKQKYPTAQVEGLTLDGLGVGGGVWHNFWLQTQRFTCLESKRNTALLCFPFCKDGRDGEVRDCCNLMFISPPDTPLPPCPSSINLPSAGRGGGGDGRGHSARWIGGADHPWRDSRSRRPLPLHGRQQHRPSRLHRCAAGGAVWVRNVFFQSAFHR